jgi:hypothetical protein
MKKPRRPDKNSVALAGEFAVLSQLAIHNFNPSLTLGHTKGVDILVSHPESRKMRRIEVKTSYSTRKKPEKTSKIFGRYHAQWIMRQKSEYSRDPNLFYCFVRYEANDQKYEFFVVPNKVVTKYLKAQRELYLLSHKKAKTEIGMFRIGLDGVDPPIATPKKKAFENKWALLR